MDELKFFKNNEELKEEIGTKLFNDISNVIKYQEEHREELIEQFKLKLEGKKR